MDLTSLLLVDRDVSLKFALMKYNKTENQLNDYISIIKNWVKHQKHFPEIPHDNVIANFLLMNKFSIQNSKQKLEMYYSIRKIFPEFFENKNPNSPHMQDAADKMHYIPLPKLTEEGYRVSIVQCVDGNPKNFQVYDFFAHTYNVAEVRLHEDVTVGDILVYDFINLKVGHFFKLSPVILRKTSIILEKVFSNRVKQIHILNSPKYASTTISLAKQVMKPKMAARIHVHKGHETIFKHISLKILPIDYGGEEIHLAVLNKMWKTKMAEYKERFDTLERIRITGQSKTIPLINGEVLGFHENFRKLDVD